MARRCSNGSVRLGSPWHTDRVLRRRAAPKRDRGGLVLVALFSAVFVLAGGAVLYRGAISPALDARAADRWTTTECTITQASIAGRIDDGTSEYMPDVRYTYDVGGQVRTGKRIGFGLERWSSDRGAVERTIARYRVGERVACHYDPDAPDQVVLVRAAPGGLSAGLAGLGFMLVGLAVFAMAVRTRHDARVRAQQAADPDAAPALIRLDENGLGDLLVAGGLAAAFTAPLPFVFDGGFTTLGRALVALLIIPLALGLQTWFWRRLLRAIGPRVSVSVAAPARLGGPLTVDVALRGWTTIRAVSVRLTGREESNDGDGADGETEIHAFLDKEIATATGDGRVARLSATCGLPRETMPTWAADANRIRWVLTIDADVARWTDVHAEYELHVAPPDDEVDDG